MNAILYKKPVKLLTVNSNMFYRTSSGLWRSLCGGFNLSSKYVVLLLFCLSSHHCLANSRSFWWCSNALSMFPRSTKALPMQLCKVPKTSFLLGTSFSDHLCTIFITSSAFFRVPSAFPDINSGMTKRTVRIFKLKVKERIKVYVYPECYLASVNFIQAFQQKSRRECAITALCTFLLHELLPHFLCRSRLLLVPKFSASVKVRQTSLNDVLHLLPTLCCTFYQVCKSLHNSY